MKTEKNGGLAVQLAIVDEAAESEAREQSSGGDQFLVGLIGRVDAALREAEAVSDRVRSATPLRSSEPASRPAAAPQRVRYSFD